MQRRPPVGFVFLMTIVFMMSDQIVISIYSSCRSVQAQEAQEAQEAPALEASGDKKKHDEKEPAWDVNQPPYPTYEVPIETDEGTWMSVDVSPDGKEIVFDLLGDIYILTLTGKARPLTSTISWDMQPRFSPDGKRIAFTSDRAGGDNIWVMNRDGSEVKQVTKESFRLLNSPVWTPDGEYIAARKHFSSRRSLGAGEIWLYHHSGGQGLQLIARPNDQKDLGEPAFSPDGRYLYYSRDVTSGSTFEYNKDSNGEIYAIQRLDRETGRVEKFIGGPGGAIRPTPSPDGTMMAYVRRVRFQSVLFIQDLESGSERPIYDALDRDMQEAWAIHGVYPSMAWTPDGSSIVFWAGGKIRRIDVKTKKTVTIPFEVKHHRKIAKALRYAVEVSPKKFKTKMLRWVQVSPDGERVVFQALGHLYLRDLPEGKARRLTSTEDQFEHYPSFSRDGKKIVYVTWNDTDFGSVREISIAGGEGRALTKRPGHYTSPSYSPDGKTVVYQKTGGGYLRSPLWSRNSGIYAVDTSGGEPRLVSRSGGGAHFGSTSDRIFIAGFENGQRTLDSIDLLGRERRSHLSSANASELRVSPDGKWVAFVERFNVYILPLVATGKAVSIGPKTQSIPMSKVSFDAGEYIHWSGDSKNLHWSLGPVLYTRNVEKSFKFLGGDKEPEPTKKGIDIGFLQTSDRPQGKTAFVNARVITMNGDEVLEKTTVIVDGNRIQSIGPTSHVKVDDAHVVDARGLTILPGFIDVHAHGAQGTQEIIPQQNWISFSELSFGVTTIHDPSNDTSTIFAASEMQRAGLIASPRVFSTGTILYGAAGMSKAVVESLEDARFHLRRMQAVGAFSVKSYNQPRRDQRQQIIQAALELGMMVVPEGGSLFHHNMTMIVDGHTGIEHCLPVANIYDDVLDLWSNSQTGYTPTLGVAYGGLSGEKYWYDHTDVWADKRLMTFVPRSQVDPIARRPDTAPESEYNHINAAKICKKLSSVGVGINLGAHGQREGLAAHWELWMFVQGGMSPHEALRAVTMNGAKYIGLDRDLGSIEVGKLADIIVLEKNPLENIRNSASIRFTMLNGRLYNARTLDEVGNHPRPRKKFFFENGGASPTKPGPARCGCCAAP